MCLTQNPDAIPAKPFLKYPKVSKYCRLMLLHYNFVRRCETSGEIGTLWHNHFLNLRN